MTAQRYPTAYIEAQGSSTYVLELRNPKRSKRLSASVMPTNERGLDVPIPLNRVPLAIRRAARAHLLHAHPSTTLTPGNVTPC